MSLQLSTAQRMSYCYARAQSAQLGIRERVRESSAASEQGEHEQASELGGREQRKQQADYSWIDHICTHAHTHTLSDSFPLCYLHTAQRHHEQTHRGSFSLSNKGMRKGEEEFRREEAANFGFFSSKEADHGAVKTPLFFLSQTSSSLPDLNVSESGSRWLQCRHPPLDAAVPPALRSGPG